MFISEILPFIFINKKLIYILEYGYWEKKKPTYCHKLTSGKMILLYVLFIHYLLSLKYI